MSRYRGVELQIKQLKELQSIITSMKTLSSLELRKLAAHTGTQQEMVFTLEDIIFDFLTFYPKPGLGEGNGLWLLIGSERGFCGGFNELLTRQLQREWPDCSRFPQRVLAVGRKLCGRLDEVLPGYTGLAGASATEEISSVLMRAAAEIQRQLEKHKVTSLQILFHRDEQGNVVAQQLLPPEISGVPVKRWVPPMLYLKPDSFFSECMQQYLLLRLTQLLTISLLVENRYRVRHLEGALHRLEEKLAALALKARLLRQEEITEEIEMILLGSNVFGFPE